MTVTSQTSFFVAISLVAVASTGFAFHCLATIKALQDKLNLLTETMASTSERTDASEDATTNDCFQMTEIGRVHSPFPQRAGCPRQGGMLAPHVRSRLIFSSHIPLEMLDGLTAYSHVWVVFAFHLNPRGKANSGRKGQLHFTATKIRPPRANGLKVGVLATRAPHRPNPVGLSIALIERVEMVKVQSSKRVCLVLRGLDLVDDTPVYDIKPYVPWDRVGSLSPIANDASLRTRMQHVITPKWVSEDDVLPHVEWTEAAIDGLIKHGHVLRPLYQDVSVEVKAAISEIVAQDPRALRDGRGTDSENDFDFSFGSLRVSFQVREGCVHVTRVLLDKGDLAATPGSYPHNLALRRRAESSALEKGIVLDWLCSVKEGMTDDLYLLKGGGSFIDQS